ncbi:MAG TPA: transglycosylase SLT domain-containing protein [Candidatus Dormibacteraeota bacterium]|nr:transglycosylase SLT domain-containing protein [Candidatus Dormibacteraeota bacterium]
MGRGTLGGVVAIALLLLAGAMAPQLRSAAQAAAPGGGGAAGTPELGLVIPAAAPAPLVTVARRAARATGADPAVLLAISQVECDFGRCRAGQSDTLVPADVRSHIDRTALEPGGETYLLLGLSDGRRIGDWVNPIPVAGGQHAMGFMQFLPSTWREEAPLAPGRPADPYRPYDSMVAAGSYLARLQNGALDGRHRSLRLALAAYGGDTAYADRVLALTA